MTLLIRTDSEAKGEGNVLVSLNLPALKCQWSGFAKADLLRIVAVATTAPLSQKKRL